MEQMRVVFIFMLMVSSAAVEEKSELTGVQGESVTFPDPVLQTGFIIFGGNLAMVDDRKFKILEEIYKDRLSWNDITGLFTLRGLQKDDSGDYTIESKTGNVFKHHHKLTVYEPVSTPVVTWLNVSTKNCTFLCSVNKTDDTTLLWYKDQKILNNSSSEFSLSITVDITSSYKCVAKSPAEIKTADVDPKKYCIQPEEKDSSGGRHCSESRDSDVIYTDVRIAEDIRAQQRNHHQESSSLTTVYDKLQAHRISPPDAADC
ncbi:uncharacterized protein LOC121508904 isoform X1 [Xyrichtys novacula]|uniref:Uncharacterized protein LOC121508904 isoform X1 n=1 Tax=Xyrichtys novacula TaxID=13765 RepID=A0AAV1EZK3_XYRNO|nr:uncharacterized protein LOC121508904 isoform X1 [Xyrichtys novacula]